MTTETKVVASIVVVTLAVIIGGIVILGGQSAGPATITVKPELLEHANSPVLAGKNPKVTIVEFADYQCPSCAALYPTLKKLIAEEGDNIRLVYRNFPFHSYSLESASAVMAAGVQGKYWEMHDIVFEKQDEWGGISDKATIAKMFEGYATTVGLNIAKYRTDIASSTFVDIIKTDQAEGVAMGVSATPTMIIGGKKTVVGAISYAELKADVDVFINASSTTTSTK